MSGGKNDKAAGYGEAHNIQLESEKRLIKQIATDISDLVSREKCERWYLAAARSINGQIVDHLEPEVRSRLRKIVPCNLTKAGKSRLLEYFSREEALAV